MQKSFTCPKCGEILSIKKGRYGTFLGCEGYPKCDYSRETPQLFKDLAEYRLEISKKRGYKPYTIFSDSQLNQILIDKPESLEQLTRIPGIGSKKCESYGEDIIRIVKDNAVK